MTSSRDRTRRMVTRKVDHRDEAWLSGWHELNTSEAWVSGGFMVRSWASQAQTNPFCRSIGPFRHTHLAIPIATKPYIRRGS